MNNNYNCVEGCDIPSTPNDIKILLKNLKLEVEKLSKTTEAKLLKHDGKIAELCKYLKDNLSNSIRCLLDSLKLSGELDDLISEALLNISRNNIINISEYGIYPGETNISLQLIIDELPSGATLYFSKGTYTFNTDSPVMTINKPITILGDGEDSTIIQNIGKGNIINIKLETEEKRFVYIEKLTLDEVNSTGRCVEVLSETGYYLAQFRMRNVKTVNGSNGFYLKGVTGDNLFISSFESCTFWNGFYADKLGDTIKINNCQFAFDGGVYINQVSGASSLEFMNNNVTCDGGFIIESATAPLIANNIFEFTRPTNNNNGFVEIVPNTSNKQYEYNIISNTFSYGANFTNYNKPLLFIGRIGKSNISNNMIGVKDNNYSVILSNLSSSVKFENTFGVGYETDTIKYGLKNEGKNNIIVGHYVDGEFIEGITTTKSFDKYTNKKVINGQLHLIDNNPIFSSKYGLVQLNYGEYVDESHITNQRVVAAITKNGFLPLDLIIGSVSNHIRFKFMQGGLPTEDLKAGDLYINRSPSGTYPYMFYYYNGSTFKGVGELHDL